MNTLDTGTWSSFDTCTMNTRGIQESESRWLIASCCLYEANEEVWFTHPATRRHEFKWTWRRWQQVMMGKVGTETRWERHSVRLLHQCKARTENGRSFFCLPNLRKAPSLAPPLGPLSAPLDNASSPHLNHEKNYSTHTQLPLAKWNSINTSQHSHLSSCHPFFTIPFQRI